MSGAVFLSYASQDAEAAKRICEALRAAGIEVWFDQSELRGGDAWDAKIRKQIRECSLFVPVISKHTQERTEGYFRLEWHLAEQRTYLMAHDQPFIVPVVVDATNDADARVPERFRERQWTRLPQGEVPPAFGVRLRTLVDGPGTMERPAIPSGKSTAANPHPPKRYKRGLVAAAVVFGACIALGFWRLWRERGNPPASGIQASNSPGAPASPVKNQLLERALALKEHYEKNGLPRTELESIELLYKKAVEEDPANASVWALGAWVDMQFYFFFADEPGVRFTQAQFKASKALALDPESFDAREAKALVLAYVVATPAAVPEGNRLVDSLLKERPGDRQALLIRGFLLENQEHYAEAAEYYRMAKDPWAEAYAYLGAMDFDKAEALANRRLAAALSAPDHSAVMGDINQAIGLKRAIDLYDREDLDLAKADFENLPPDVALNEEVAVGEIDVFTMRREPEKALEILNQLPGDWLSQLAAGGSQPKAAYIAVAHELAGRPEAAKLEWQAALKLIDASLLVNSDSPRLILQRAWALAHLGETAGAKKQLQLYEQLKGKRSGEIQKDTLNLYVFLGSRDAVLVFLNKLYLEEKHYWEWGAWHASMRYNPIFDPMRGDARFEKLLKDTLPKQAKPLP
jgi:hypothetical protein